MVAPLFAMSSLWERFDWRSSRLLQPRSFSLRLGPLRRTVTGTAAASGVLLAAMGGATLYLGLASDAMPSGTGWQADVSSELQLYGTVVTDALGWVPGWAGALAMVGLVVLLARRAIVELLGPRSEPPPPDADRDSADPSPDRQYA